jgi:phage gpG-like protein
MDVKLIHLQELRADLGDIPGSVRASVEDFMQPATETLRGMVKANIGDTFKSTGPLFNSVQGETETSGDAITGRVYTEGVPYAAIQEFGGQTSPHDILPVRAQVLAFMGQGRLGFSSGNQQSETVFAKVVHHPGSRMPERSYARRALADFREPFTEGIRAAVARAINENTGFRMAAE